VFDELFKEREQVTSRGRSVQMSASIEGCGKASSRTIGRNGRLNHTMKVSSGKRVSLSVTTTHALFALKVQRR
jgi:hypothetical protein